MHNPRKRVILKSITWETFSNLVCFALAFVMFGNLGGCALFTVIAIAVKLVLFYGHERLWEQFND